jgi:CTLH/CRA C-terminal to LisH motif domain
LSDASVEE